MLVNNIAQLPASTMTNTFNQAYPSQVAIFLAVYRQAISDAATAQA
jgi:hypothetical protein